MIILDDDGWRIIIEERQFILTKYTGKYTDKKTGKEIDMYSKDTYHSTLADALKQYKRYLLTQASEGKELTLDEAIKFIQDLDREFIERLEKITTGV